MKKSLSFLLYTIAYGFWYLMSLLPLRVLYIISDILCLLVADVVRYRHKVIWNNLKTSFPEKTDQELKEIQRGFYHYFCDYLVETIKLMTMSQDELRKRMTFTGMEEFNKALSEGQSLGVYLGHLGNWEWITAMPLWTPDALCCQLYHPLENEYFDRLFKYVRERQGALCIPMQESLRKIIQFRREGKPLVVGYISDQVPLWWNIHHWLDFLHHDTPVLTGAERIVKHTGQAFVYGDVTRVRRGYYNCEMKVIRRDTKDIPDYELTDIYFHELEKTILRQPEIYLWSHNRWKRTREEFNRYYYVDDNGKVIMRKNLS
ncbi:lysophospholipid acyltransferase family protein [Segatella albensis]|uniref:lysophospholipid acyltransferase family protein n=1 Tax=Segatella albensis TaxID=77768 RepID=UPI0003F93864|nr:lysophospholipid acyltransferase family protein [Segatella albensis]